jgi:glycosylphosphatidylinositol transamidase (GPIT) subunit GPI8
LIEFNNSCDDFLLIEFASFCNNVSATTDASQYKLMKCRIDKQQKKTFSNRLYINKPKERQVMFLSQNL